MARIRTIKPEFPQSESMGRVSREARLCFILLWTICDDSGRTRASSRMLASLLYPYDEDAGKRIDGWLTELETENCIVRYEIDGNTYLEVRNWLNHQRIDKPSASKIPPFVESSRILANVRESSCEEGKGKERKGREGNGRERTLAESVSPPAGKELELPPNLNRQAWDEWVAYRRERRLPVGTTVLRKHLNLLASYDAATQQTMIDSAIGSSWQGLFAPKGIKPVVGNGKPPMPPEFIDGAWNPEFKVWMEKWG